MLSVTDLNQYYGGSHILRDLSFEVPAGKVTALLGRNGVGKTTLLRALMGLVPTATGTMRFGDDDLTQAPPYRRAHSGIGYVPQGREIFPRLTVEENLLMGLAARPRGTRIPEGIQPSIILEIERVIRSIAEAGDMAILLVEQYYDFARSLADQYLVMERGEIIARGRGEEMERDGVKALLAV